jgi:hypothetical protein
MALDGNRSEPPRFLLIEASNFDPVGNMASEQ